MNIWDDEWGEQDEDWSGGGGRRKRLVRARPSVRARRDRLRARPRQFHGLPLPPRLGGAADRAARPPDAAHARRRAAARRGRVRALPAPGPTARTGSGTTPTSPSATSSPARASRPEVVEYPDLKQLTAQSRHDSMTGERLFVIHDVKEDA